MARRRGLGNAERLACDFTYATATGALISAPCFVYQIHSTLAASTATGTLTLSDSTSTSDWSVGGDPRFDMKFGSSAASANSEFHYPRSFNPPLFVARNLYWQNSTNIASVSIEYIAAS